MKHWFIGAAISLSVSLAVATGAQAQTITNDAFDQTASLPSWAKVVTFDSPLPSGFSLYGGKIVRGNGPGYAAPAGDSTNYLVADKSFAVLKADQAYQSVGFYWGSVDTFNVVKLLDSAGRLIASFTGKDIPPANGDQSSAATNRYVTYTLDPAQGFRESPRWCSPASAAASRSTTSPLARGRTRPHLCRSRPPWACSRSGWQRSAGDWDASAPG